MKYRRKLTSLASIFLIWCTACSQGSGSSSNSNSGGSGSPPTTTDVSTVPTGPNVMGITVGSCGSYTYVDEPCVSVTICTPGTTTCQTIPNILLDTGSFGLRIFSSLITINLTPEAGSTNGSTVGECAEFGSANTWGPVELADVVLGGEGAVEVPIQVIDSTFAGGKYPKGCQTPTPVAGPQDSGFNGILGVGLFNQDCGSGCEAANNGLYFSCSGNTCIGLAASLADQVANPVGALPVDNNGVIIDLPQIAQGGVNSVSGYAILGIGTESNNVPSGVTAYPADQDANFTTSFDGTTYTNSFIDSGSNAIYFAGDNVLAACPSNSVAEGFYCPTMVTSLDATNTGATGNASGIVDFSVMNAETVFNSGLGAYDDLVGSNGGSGFGFDWGLPFFFGQLVYVGMDGSSSSLGSGPYWAY